MIAIKIVHNPSLQYVDLVKVYQTISTLHRNEISKYEVILAQSESNLEAFNDNLGFVFPIRVNFYHGEPLIEACGTFLKLSLFSVVYVVGERTPAMIHEMSVYRSVGVKIVVIPID